MAKFVLIYIGGTGGTGGESPEEMEDVMADWMGFFGELGDSLLDGGNPFGPAAAIDADGDAEVTSRAGGYSVIEAEDLEEAKEMAAGCPHLKSGGTIEIHEAMPIG